MMEPKRKEAPDAVKPMILTNILPTKSNAICTGGRKSTLTASASCTIKPIPTNFQSILLRLRLNKTAIINRETIPNKPLSKDVSERPK